MAPSFCMRILLVLVTITGSVADLVTSFRGLYTRHGDMRLTSLPRDQVTQVTVEECARRCVTEVGFDCKSFDYNNKKQECLLFATSLDDTDVRLIDNPGTDHYQTAYVRLFSRSPQHRLEVTVRGQETGVSVETCSRLCVLERQFRCQGFNYRSSSTSQPSQCQLLDKSPALASGILLSPSHDYYQRQPDGAMAQFVNLGMGRLQEAGDRAMYEEEVRSVTVEACAQLCLAEQSFACLSFDYTFTSQLCQLSRYTAANVFGLDTRSSNPIVNHFEKIGDYMTHFYPTPYSVLIGNDVKSYSQVTVDYCAQMCVTEQGFVCRSFDYEVRGGVCSLSGKTGSDVGGLYSDYTQQVHHFELKPILDCGGNLTQPTGDLASPNWPRPYAHHERCTWIIRAARNKVIHLRFVHFDLGQQSGDLCNARDDRLVVSERGQRSYCVSANIKNIVSKTNELNITFLTNSVNDAQGFRAFYTAEWTCDAYLYNSPGEVASPSWPASYPASARCSWRIVAPEGARVRLMFSSFELERHSLGHCGDTIDNVRILDGGTVSSPLIGLYCGSQAPFTVRSSRRDMFVQFWSDSSAGDTLSAAGDSRRGFHATFVFETLNGSVITTFDSAGEGKFVELDGGNSGRREQTTPLQREHLHVPDGAQSAIGAQPSADQSHGDYKRTMTAVIATLVMLLLAAILIVFLVWRYYRKKLHDQQDRTVVSEAVPLTLLTTGGNDTYVTSGADDDGMAAAAQHTNITNNLRELYAKDTNLKQVNVAGAECGSSKEYV